MRRSDQLDAILAKHFAWSFALPGDTANLAERLRAAEEEGTERADATPPPLPDDRDSSETQARAMERSRKACRPLALAVTEAWAIADDEASARAAKRLLTRADRLGVVLIGMDAYPAEAVRLLRLLVRHGPKMTRRQRERSAYAATILPLSHPETADLLVEVARAADREMARALRADEEWKPELDDSDAIVARLADVIDAGPSHACRAVAVDLVTLFDRRETAAPALRRALRLPSFAVRARALHALATAEPCAVLEADLVHVLRDLVAHAPPDSLRDEEQEDDERTLADSVVTALSRVRPEEVEETLLDLIDAEHDTMWLDAGWATEALAVAFPATAAVMVDHWLKCARVHERTRALAALARLPDDLAEPRLRRAASDPALAVRDSARRQWLDRFQRACPVGSADLLGASLIRTPGSDRFAARLAVMQGRVAAARQAMSRALLAEAPDPEALALLLQLVGDDAESGEPSFSSREGDGGWSATIVRHFGALGVEGLCVVAARFSEPETFGWMRRLGDLVERGVIAREHSAPLRELAARHVTSDDAGRVDDALRVLSLVGAPPELLDRVLAVALEDDLGAPEARGLLISWRDRAVDARLASEMALALADHDWTRLHNAAAMGLARGGHAARVIAQRVLEVAEHDEAAVDAAGECARHLRDAGALEDAWAVDVISRPESPLFAAVARVWRRSPAVRAGLEAALASSGRASASAVEAAIALLQGEPPISPRDRRVMSLLERAAAPQRAELLYALCVRGAPIGLVAPHLEELLISPDPAVTGALAGIAVWLKSPRARVFLRGMLPRVVDVELSADIEDALGTAAVPFWEGV
jgi:hypothetical protein